MVSQSSPAINFDNSKQCMAPYIESVTKYEALHAHMNHIYTIKQDVLSWGATVLVVCGIAALFFNPLSFFLLNIIGIGLNFMGLGIISLVCLSTYKVFLVLLGIAALTYFVARICVYIYDKKYNNAEHEQYTLKKGDKFEIRQDFKEALELFSACLLRFSSSPATEVFSSAYVEKFEDNYLNKLDELQIKPEDQKKLLQDLLVNIFHVLIYFKGKTTLGISYVRENYNNLTELENTISRKISNIEWKICEQLIESKKSTLENAEPGKSSCDNNKEQINESKNL